jgi:hypothetical protein
MEAIEKLSFIQNVVELKNLKRHCFPVKTFCWFVKKTFKQFEINILNFSKFRC